MSQEQALIAERDLRGWKFIARFQALLAKVRADLPPSSRETHGLRQLHAPQYLSLFLLGLFNPIVSSMRGLCAASRLGRVQREVSGQAVALSRFSEAQQVFEPQLVQRVMAQLVAQSAAQVGAAHGGFSAAAVRVVDSTLWKVIPRMNWAVWRHQYCQQRAVRLHVKLRLCDALPTEATVTNGRGCERAALRAHLVPGEIYLGDRYYGEDYGLLEQMEQKGCGFLLRLRQETVLHWHTEEPLSPADQAAGIRRGGRAWLGVRQAKGPWRVLWLERAGQEPVILVASQCFESLSAAEVAALYRQRWQVELFFRWLKCLLPCRHWFAQSQRGVSFQIYLSLISALLLAEATGRRPSKRMMELLAWHQMGWATLEELEKGLRQEVQQSARKKSV